MTGRTLQSRRIAAPWLASPPLGKVFDALENGGAEVRIVGGAVRDALLGMPVSEVDLATTAPPNDTIRLAAAAGLGAHPTGIDHGTITIVADGETFEVTTLRRDVETDGRRAVVAFTSDWAEDASRRDFTINGLSCGRDGKVHDTVGGLADIDARRVRFIGDAETRIREDYLRILRFFRFSAAYAGGGLDHDGLAAAISLRNGLLRLSAERIGAEMMKLLQGPRAGEISKVMQAAGILELTIGGAGVPDRLLRLQTIEATLGDAPDPLTRLAALALDSAAGAKPLAERLRLSNSEVSGLATAVAGAAQFDSAMSEAGVRALLYRLGPKSYARAVRLAWAQSSAPESSAEWRARATLPARWTAAAMPFSGGDILALGVAPGPRVGAILDAFEAWWIGQDFPDDAATLKAHLAALAKRD